MRIEVAETKKKIIHEKGFQLRVRDSVDEGMRHAHMYVWTFYVDFMNLGMTSQGFEFCIFFFKFKFIQIILDQRDVDCQL